MDHAKMEANVISYSAGISACEKGGEWEKALLLLAKMEGAKVEADVVSYSAVISACEKGGEWKKAI
eukprot:3842799-Prorocentrum_lima.AAC.1